MLLRSILLACLTLPLPAAAETFRCVTKGATTVLKDGSPELVDAMEGKSVSLTLDARAAHLVLVNDANSAVSRFACRPDGARPRTIACTRPDESLRLNRRTGMMLRTVTTPGIDFVLSLILVCTRPKPGVPGTPLPALSG